MSDEYGTITPEARLKALCDDQRRKQAHRGDMVKYDAVPALVCDVEALLLKLASSKKNLDDYRSISDEMINERAMLVREIVAWFDVMHSKYVSDGTPVELSEEWPSDWMRRAREILE